MFVKGNIKRVVTLDISLDNEEAQKLYRLLNMINRTGALLSEADKCFSLELANEISNKIHFDPMK